MADTILFYGLIEFLMKISCRKYPIFDYHVALIQFCVVLIHFRVVLIRFHVAFIHFRVTFTLSQIFIYLVLFSTTLNPLKTLFVLVTQKRAFRGS